jgi:hypothetical protein
LNTQRRGNIAHGGHTTESIFLQPAHSPAPSPAPAHRRSIRIFRTPALLLAFLLIALFANAQQPITLQWPLTSPYETAIASPYATLGFAAGKGIDSLRFSPEFGAMANGWNTDNQDPEAYYEYRITPAPGTGIVLSRLNMEVSLSRVNMRTSIHYSLNDFKTSTQIGYTIFVGTRTPRNLPVKTSISVFYPQTLSIRIYGWSAVDHLVDFHVRNAAFEGVVHGKDLLAETQKPEEPEVKEPPVPEPQITPEEVLAAMAVTPQDTAGTGGNLMMAPMAGVTYPPGSYTWTSPANVTCIKVEAWSGGGAGGTVSTNTTRGGGGGGGGYARSTVTVTPITPYSVVVGAGGTGGSPSTGGGHSSFGTSLVYVTGGQAGINTTGGAGGGGTGTIGQTIYTGGNGANGVSTSDLSGGGGGGAGSGVSGSNASGSSGGNGGTPDGGKGGNGVYTGNNGFPGNTLGGGGSGGNKSTGSGSYSGGNGAGGQVRITYISTIFDITPAGNHCFGTPVNIGLSGSETGITYLLYRDGSQIASINGTGGAISFGTYTIAGTYTVTATISQCTCTLDMNGSVVIHPVITISLGSIQPICEGTTSASLPYSSTAGSPTLYSIDFNAAAEAAGFVDVTDQTLPASPIIITVPESAPPATYNATVTVKNSTTNCSSIGYSIAIIIRATPVAPASATASLTEICNNHTTNITLTATGGSGGVLRWYRGSCGGTLIGEGSPLSITPPTTTTTYYARWENSPCTPSACASVQVTVRPPVSNPGAITGDPVVCPNLTGIPYSIAPVANATTYTWTEPSGWTIESGNGTNVILVTTGAAGQNGTISVTAGNVCGTSTASTLSVTVQAGTPNTPGTISGIVEQCPLRTNQTYSVAVVPNASTYNWTVPGGWAITGGQGTNSITVTTGNSGDNGNITVTAGNTCGTSEASILAVTVEPGTPSTPGLITGPALHCGQQTGQNYSVDPVSGATTYNWTLPSGWTITGGVNTNSITVTTGLPGDNGTITVSAGNSCGTSGTSSLEVVVSKLPDNAGPILPNNTNVCQGSTQTYYVEDNLPPDVVYNWTVPSDWTISSGQGTLSITVIVGASSGDITVTPNNICGNGPSSSLNISVKPLPLAAGPITGDDEVCAESSQTYSIEAVANADSYLWTIPAGWTIQNGQGGTTIQVTVGTASGNIVVTPQNSCGNGTAGSLYVTVNPLPAAYTGPNGELCVGGTTQIGGPPVGSNTYLWSSNPIDPEMVTNVSNPWISPEEDTWYTLTETNPTTGCSKTNSVFVRAKQDIQVFLNVTSQIICSGETTNIQISSNILGADISWEAALTNGTGISGYENGTGSIISQTLINASTAPGEVTYYIKVEGSGGCYNKAEVIVTVNPVTTPTISGPNNVCQNSTGNAYTTQAGMTDYSWTVTGGTITGGQGTSQITVTWNTAGPQTVSVSYKNSYGCTGNSAGYSVNVKPIPVITVSPVTQGPVCSGTAITPIEVTPTVGGTTYAWTRDNTTILTGIPATGTTFPISGTLTSTQPATLQTTDFKIVATAAGCTFETSASVTVGDVTPPTITCKPSPQNRNSNTGVCTYTVVGTEFDPESWGDNCPNAVLTNSFNGSSTLAGAVLPGSLTITWTVTAANGTKVSCDLVVVITDNQAPVIIGCPANITVSTGPGRTTCDQVATWTPPTATDNCAPTVTWTSTHTPGSIFPVGTTTVTYTASDGSNTATCSFTVTVIDDTPPTFTCPPAVTVYLSNSCTANTGISITGDVTNEFDNCTPTGLQATYSDSPLIPGACPGTGTINRTWTLTDIHGNTSSCVQVITISDNTPPVLTAPSNITISCHLGTDPSVTGQATSTDNCSPVVNIAYTDNVVNPDPNCPAAAIVTRTWTATDCSGNTTSRVQTITVRDNVPPVVTNPGNMVVNCPRDIPEPDPSTVEAYDLCGNVTITFHSEQAQFPPAVPGYCPDYVIRYYQVKDECGNITMAEQMIDVLNPTDPLCECQECLTTNSNYNINFYNRPAGDTTLYGVSRLDYCCHAQHPTKCVSFSIFLDEEAVGLQIWVSGGFQKTDWKVDCEGVEISNDGIVCLPGGTYYLFTYCKPGSNENNDFRFTSLAGILLGGEIEARVNCNSQLSVNTSATSATWNSVYPGYPGQYNSYLSCTTCLSPVFTPGPGAPATIIYEVCGVIPDQPCVGFGGTICDQVTIHVHDAIEVEFDVDPAAYCQNEIPTIEATITPEGTTYTLEWYDNYGGTGTLVGTGYTFTPTQAGPYSLVVHDNDNGIPCSTYIYDFDVAADNVPPVVYPPEPDLVLECNDPQNQQLIQNWLSLARAEDDHNTVIRFENDYNGITQTCGEVLVVSFTAEDDCHNIATETAKITIVDTQAPTWTTLAGALDRSVECSDAAGLANALALFPNATDACDPLTLIVEKTSGSFVAGSCPQAGTYTNTWTATDKCGNVSAQYVQVITITDQTAPVWTTLSDALNVTVNCSDATALAAAQALMPVATDNCDNTLVPVKTAGAFIPGSLCNSAGTYTNTFLVTDDCGNTSITFTQIITVVDTEGPVIERPAENLTVECDGTGNTTDLNNWLSSQGGASAYDVCGGTITWTHNFTTLSDDCGATGFATVTFTASDACGNTSITTATFTITDTQAPVLTCPPDFEAQINTVDCTVENVDLGEYMVSDNCSAEVDILVTNNAPTFFPQGVTIVTWIATDACGNTSTCEQTVTVVDLFPPEVICPDPITVNADPGKCSAFVNVTPPEVTDPCPVTITITIDGTVVSTANRDYPVGETTVVWTITGISGVYETCNQLITVVDTQAPTISCPENQVFTAEPPDCELIISVIPDPVLTDNCDVNDLILSWTAVGATPESGTGSVNGTVFPVGVTTVTYTVTDGAGLTDECSFTVTVSSEVPPTITTCPHNMTVPNDAGECQAYVTVPAPYIEDPCNEIVSVTNDYTNTGDASGTYPVGLTIVVWTIEDFLGNIDTCQQRIWVQDTELPTIVCPDNIYAIATPPLCEVPDYELTAPLYGDNCPGYKLSWSMEMGGITVDSGEGELLEYTFPVGITTVTYTVTDAAGNTNTCSFTVTINDDVPPTIVDCPDPVTTVADDDVCSAYITITGPAIDDPCNEIVSVTHNSPIGTPENASGNYPVGETIITWIITDIWGETDECEQLITVTDNQDPTLVCPSNITAIATPPLCEVPDFDLTAPTYGDNCPGYELSWSMEFGGITVDSGEGELLEYTFPVGITTITYTITDAAGNINTCSFTVTINDEVPPTIVDCPDPVTTVADDDLCSAYITITGPAIDDPCNEIVSVTHNSPVGTPENASGNYPVGTTTITWTITDTWGETDECEQIITVVDDQDPYFTYCPPDAIDEIIAGGCDMIPGTIGYPTFDDNCEVVWLTWEMSGATTGSNTDAGINYVNGETFNVGQTFVTYTAYDAAGNSDECTFMVWVKNLNAPEFKANCPDDMVVYSPFDLCGANVTVIRPEIINPCDETFTITCDSPYGENPDGFYPIGTTTITWTITDASGTETVCEQDITVIDDIDPVLVCPDDFEWDADFELPYATNVPIPPPTNSDICGIEFLYWELVGDMTPYDASPTDGIYILDFYTLYIGNNTITYTAIDFNGNVTTCSFDIFINSEPVIECAGNIEVNNDPRLCSAAIDPGVPTLISGLAPVWHWIIRDEDNNIIGEGDGRPIVPVPFTFPVGVNTITWTATNISGFDECVQTITVTDTEAPTFTAPGPFNFCVINIISAQYDGAPEPAADIIPINPADGNPRRPDWYLVGNGSTELDITALADNCCDAEDIIINWTITFDPLIGGSLSGIGQPSLSTPIQLWGTHTNVEVNHTITYTVTDFNGNEAAVVTRNILVRPRPEVIKLY